MCKNTVFRAVNAKAVCFKVILSTVVSGNSFSNLIWSNSQIVIVSSFPNANAKSLDLAPLPPLGGASYLL